MGFFDNVKKIFDSGEKEDVKSQNSTEKIDKFESMESINNNFDEKDEIQLQNSQKLINNELNDKTTSTENIRSFEYLDDLIHGDEKDIVLNFDIVLSSIEMSKYEQGIELDVDGLTIDGNGHSIDAQEKTRIFNCTGKNIIIKNIILKKGYAEYGGTIFNDGGELTIVESTLKHNNCDSDGGAIYNRGELTIIKSKFYNNTAYSGGAIYNYNINKLTITESVFSDNTSEWDGGAILNNGESTIKKSVFNKNKSLEMDGDGGVIYNGGGESGTNFPQMGKLIITESTFTENMANGFDSSVIKNYDGYLKIYNCEFFGNMSRFSSIIFTSDSLQIYNSDFIGNKSVNVISNNGDISNLSIFYCKFIKNIVDGSEREESSGCGRVDASVIENDGKSCHIEKTLFENNLSGENSYNIVNYGDLTLVSPKIKDDGESVINDGNIIIK